MECLNYQQPQGGRPLPTDQNAADHAHWQIRLEVGDLAGIDAQLESYGGSRVSPGIVELEPAQAELLGFTRGLQVRDPDGHQLQLVSP